MSTDISEIEKLLGLDRESQLIHRTFELNGRMHKILSFNDYPDHHSPPVIFAGGRSINVEYGEWHGNKSYITINFYMVENILQQARMDRYTFSLLNGWWHENFRKKN